MNPQVSNCAIEDELLARWDLAAFGAHVSASHAYPGRPADAIISGENLGTWWGVPPEALRDGVTVTVTLPHERPIKLIALHWAQWPIPVEFAVSEGNTQGPLIAAWRAPMSQREFVRVPDTTISAYTIHVRLQPGATVSNGSLLVQGACFGRLTSGPMFRSLQRPGEWFGLSSHLGYADSAWWNGASEVRLAKSLGMRWLRITARWDVLAPSGAGLDDGRLNVLDQHIGLAHSAGMKILLLIHGTPGWASSTPIKLPGAGRPSSPALFVAFVERLYRRFGSQVDAWEIWNEPNSADYFGPPTKETAALLAAMYRDTRAQLRSINPNVTVVLGSLSRVDTKFLLQVLDSNPGPIDVVGVHPYTDGRDPLSWFGSGATSDSCLFPLSQEGIRYWRNLATFRAALDLRGYASTPVWLTEIGWDVIGKTGVGAVGQSAFLMRGINAVWSDVRGITQGFWFSSKDWGENKSNGVGDNMGLVDSSGAPRPVANAIRALADPARAAPGRVTSVVSEGAAQAAVFHGWGAGDHQWVIQGADGMALLGASTSTPSDDWVEVHLRSSVNCITLVGI